MRIDSAGDQASDSPAAEPNYLQVQGTGRGSGHFDSFLQILGC